MTLLAGTAVTLEEFRKRLDKDDKIAAIIELLMKTNEILIDMPFLEGNLPTGHMHTIRTGLPSITWRKLNQGVQPSKSQTAQVTDTCGMCEGYAEVDKALADLNGNTAAFRAQEASGFLQAFNNEMATKLFYGDSSLNPEQPLGLAPRYPYKDSPNVVDFGGSGSDVTSIWICVLGAETCCGIYPKGSKVGFTHQDLGQVTLEDASGGKYEGYRDHFKWDIGLAVKNWQYVVRCCNVESAGLSGTGTNNLIDKIHLLIQAINLIPDMNMGMPVIYCNKDILTQFEVMAFNKVGPVTYTVDAGGKFQVSFKGIPLRKCEAILSTETALIATP